MSLIGFTGHAGLPATTNRLVAQALRSRLVGRSNLVGISLLGPGADQLFSRIVLELGGSLYVVVPASTYRNAFQDKAAQQEYERLCTLASRLEQLPYTESNEHAHMEAGKVLVERCDVLVAVWDGKPSRGLGGTADVVAYAHQRGVPVERIWPNGATRD